MLYGSTICTAAHSYMQTSVWNKNQASLSMLCTPLSVACMLALQHLPKMHAQGGARQPAQRALAEGAGAGSE